MKKTDERDAAPLPLYLSKGLLPKVRMKDKEHGQLASLTQTRDTLVTLRTALKKKVNNILSARGINLSKEALSSEKRLAEVLTLPFDQMVLVELRVVVGQIRSLNNSIAELEKTIAEEGSKPEGHKSLTSITGIGKISGAILLSVIGDVDDFPDQSRLASYFGIVPRVSNSNESEHIVCAARAPAGTLRVTPGAMQRLLAVSGDVTSGVIGALALYAIPDPLRGQGVFTAPLTAGGESRLQLCALHAGNLETGRL